MKFKEGDRVVVCDRLHGHQFEIGEVVYIMEAYVYGYICTNGCRRWSLGDNELEPIHNIPRNIKKLNFC